MSGEQLVVVLRASFKFRSCSATRRPAWSRARSAPSSAPRSRWSWCCPRFCSCLSRSPASLVALAAWIFGYVGYRIVASQSEAALEMMGLSSRPLVHTQAFSAHNEFARGLVGRDGRPAACRSLTPRVRAAIWWLCCMPCSSFSVLLTNAVISNPCSTRPRASSWSRSCARRRPASSPWRCSNEYYDSLEAYLAALGKALQVEYEAIVRGTGSCCRSTRPDLALERHITFKDEPVGGLWFGFVEQGRLRRSTTRSSTCRAIGCGCTCAGAIRSPAQPRRAA